MDDASYAAVYRRALLCVVTERDEDVSIGTGLYIRHEGADFVIGAEHESTLAETYRIAPVIASGASVFIDDDPEHWQAVEVAGFKAGRHPILLRLPNDAEDLVANRRPLPLDWISGRARPLPPSQTSTGPGTVDTDSGAHVRVGDGVRAFGFWAKQPSFPAQMRSGIVSVRHDGTTFLDMKIVHGNSGGPVWRMRDGRFVGCAQLNLYGDIVLDQSLPSPGGPVDSISNHANLILCQSPTFLFNDGPPS